MSDGCNAWTLATHTEDLNRGLGSCLHPGPALANAVIWVKTPLCTEGEINTEKPSHNLDITLLKPHTW